MTDHWRNMLAGKSGNNRKLYNKLTSIFRDGYPAPIYEKLLECEDEKACFLAERFFIKTFGRDTLCNLTNGGQGATGVIWSEETRAKMRGPKSLEHRQKIAEANRGKPKSAEHRENMSKGLRGRKMPLVWLEKQSKRCLGKPLTAEHCQNVSKALLGHVHSPETRKKLRTAALGNQRWLGKTHSPETCQKIREIKLGKTHNAKARENMRKSQLKRWALRKLEAA
jgi:hypothetical protein